MRGLRARRLTRPARMGVRRSLRGLASLALLLLGGTAVGACRDATSTDSQPAARVDVRPDSTQVEVDDTVRFSATAFDHDGRVLSDREPAWSTSDSAVASVVGEGRVTGVSVGGASVFATLSAARGSASVSVVRSSGDVPPEPIPGQIVVDPSDPAWFRHAGGGPFFMCGPGDPEGFLYRGDRRPDGTRDGDQRELIEKLGGTGANSLYVMAVRSHGGDGDATENPFVGNDPERGLNEAILDQWEQWFTALEERGVVVFFLFYDDGALVWETGDEVGGSERSFLQRLVNRFEHHGNIIWAVAEEYQESYSRERVSRIARIIRQADDHAHPVAVHQLPGTRFDFPDDPYLDQFAAQVEFDEGVEAFHEELVGAFSRARGRYNLTMAEGQPDHGAQPADRIREINWAAAMAGAYVMVLRWDVASTPRSQLEDCGHMVELLERTPLPRLEPHDELADGRTRWVLADPGDAYVLYASSADSTLGLRDVPAGRYDLTWMDAETGRIVEETDAALEGGDTELAVPGEIGAEVVVFLRRVDA